jgi:hypothetical protein
VGRGGQDYKGYIEKRGFSFDFIDDFPAIPFGQVQVKNDKVGQKCVGKPAAAENEIQRLFAVTDDVEAMFEACLFEGLLNQKDVADTVLGPQNPDSRLNHSSSFLGVYFVILEKISPRRYIEG